MRDAPRIHGPGTTHTAWRVVYRPWMLLCIAWFVCIIPGCRVVVGEDCVDIIGIEGQIFNSCIDSVLPAPITNQAVDASDTTITITWTPSVSDDVAEIHMTWSSPHRQEEEQLKIMDADSIAATITELHPYTEYTVRINTVDASGNVSPTAEITATTAASLLFADAPSFSSAETPGSTVGQVSAIVHPPNTAITIASYEIIANRDDDSALFAIDSQTGEITVADTVLNPHASYTFTVQATSTQGISTTTIVTVAPTDTTAPDSVTMLRGTADSDGTSIDLSWNGSYSTDVASLTVAWALPGAPDIIGSTPASTSSGSVVHTITGLMPYTLYDISITVTDTVGNARTRSISIHTAANRIDRDGNNLIDINTLSALHNMRYNLAGTSYKEHNSDNGILCGRSADTTCIGYELTQDLDFTDAASYDNGVVNAAWRPQNSSGTVLAQSSASSATNPGWNPIGSCNADDGDNDSDVCGDSDDTPLATRFVGNGHTISNLYAHNNNNAFGVASGLFGITTEQATIHAVTLDSARLYGGSNADRIGALVGHNEGTITESAAHGTVAGNGATDNVGMLVGRNNGTISASYATGTVDGGAGDRDSVGGLVGFSNGSVIASYASGDIDGGAGNTDNIGGLVGASTLTATTVASSANSVFVAEMGNDAIGGLMGANNGILIASYSRSAVVGGAGEDTIGGLVGSVIKGALIASYATGAVDGGGDNDTVGGLLGGGTAIVPVIASYATGAVTGGSSGTTDTVGALRGIVQLNPDGVIASYGFGVVSNADNPGLDHIDRPSAAGVIVGTSTAGAALLLAPDSSDTTNTAVPSIWNSAGSNTLNAWDFGTTTDIPVLRYADYDGTGTTYGCIDANNPTSTATIVIPNRVPDGIGGMRTITCGSTLLHSQVR